MHPLSRLHSALNKERNPCSYCPRLGGPLPVVDTSHAAFSPNGIPSGRGETATRPSARADHATRAAPVLTPLAGVPAGAGTVFSQTPASLGAAPLRFEANLGQTD